MSWIVLNSLEGLDAIVEASDSKLQLIFKHSTRCGISSGARRRLDGSIRRLSEHFSLHYLDLIAFREVSNAIAERFGVKHESPQVLAIWKGESIFNMSHYNIQPAKITELAEGHKRN